MEVTKDSALELLIRIEMAYLDMGALGQAMTMASVEPSTLAKSFQLLIDDGTLFTLVACGDRRDPLYFQRLGVDLIRSGICKIKEKE